MADRKIVAFQVVFTLLFVALLAMACGGQEPTKAQPTTAVAATAPIADGAALLQARCTICHSLDRVKQARKTLAEWETTVKRMKGKGANLNDQEVQALAQYLAETYRK